MGNVLDTHTTLEAIKRACALLRIECREWHHSFDIQSKNHPFKSVNRRQVNRHDLYSWFGLLFLTILTLVLSSIHLQSYVMLIIVYPTVFVVLFLLIRYVLLLFTVFLLLLIHLLLIVASVHTHTHIYCDNSQTTFPNTANSRVSSCHNPLSIISFSSFILGFVFYIIRFSSGCRDDM